MLVALSRHEGEFVWTEGLAKHSKPTKKVKRRHCWMLTLLWLSCNRLNAE